MLFRRRPKEEERPEWLIVGLGNPGTEYLGTRHNVGWVALEQLAKDHRIKLDTRRLRSRYGTGRIADVPVVLAMPMTYMNLSGEAVRGLLRHFEFSPDRLLVIADEMALPLGQIRLRGKGSAGGQKGMDSIIQVLGTQEFPRLRIGIDRANPGWAMEHVLGKFSREEMERIGPALDRAVQAVEAVLTDGLERAMDEFNRKE